MQLGQLHEAERTPEARLLRVIQVADVEGRAGCQAGQTLGALGQVVVGRRNLEGRRQLAARGEDEVQHLAGKELCQRTAVDGEISQNGKGAQRAHLHSLLCPDHARGQGPAVDLQGAQTTAFEAAAVAEGQRRVQELPDALQHAENALPFDIGNVELLPASLGLAQRVEAAHAELQADSSAAKLAILLCRIRCTAARGRLRIASS
jgi:hypothetical protein